MSLKWLQQPFDAFKSFYNSNADEYLQSILKGQPLTASTAAAQPLEIPPRRRRTTSPSVMPNTSPPLPLINGVPPQEWTLEMLTKMPEAQIKQYMAYFTDLQKKQNGAMKATPQDIQVVQPLLHPPTAAVIAPQQSNHASSSSSRKKHGITKQQRRRRRHSKRRHDSDDDSDDMSLSYSSSSDDDTLRDSFSSSNDDSEEDDNASNIVFVDDAAERVAKQLNASPVEKPQQVAVASDISQSESSSNPTSIISKKSETVNGAAAPAQQQRKSEKMRYLKRRNDAGRSEMTSDASRHSSSSSSSSKRKSRDRNGGGGWCYGCFKCCCLSKVSFTVTIVLSILAFLLLLWVLRTTLDSVAWTRDSLQKTAQSAQWLYGTTVSATAGLRDSVMWLARASSIQYQDASRPPQQQQPKPPPISEAPIVVIDNRSFYERWWPWGGGGRQSESETVIPPSPTSESKTAPPSANVPTTSTSTPPLKTTTTTPPPLLPPEIPAHILQSMPSNKQDVVSRIIDQFQRQHMDVIAIQSSPQASDHMLAVLVEDVVDHPEAGIVHLVTLTPKSYYWYPFTSKQEARAQLLQYLEKQTSPSPPSPQPPPSVPVATPIDNNVEKSTDDIPPPPTFEKE